MHRLSGKALLQKFGDAFDGYNFLIGKFVGLSISLSGRGLPQNGQEDQQVVVDGAVDCPVEVPAWFMGLCGLGPELRFFVAIHFARDLTKLRRNSDWRRNSNSRPWLRLELPLKSPRPRCLRREVELCGLVLTASAAAAAARVLVAGCGGAGKGGGGGDGGEGHGLGGCRRGGRG